MKDKDGEYSMKKMFALILALCLATMMVSALAEDVTGTWYLNGGYANGVEMDISSMGISMEFTFNADGSAKVYMEMYGQAQSADGTWTLDGDKLTVTVDGSPLELKYEGDRLAVEASEGTWLYLGREKPVAKEFAAPITAESIEQFNGDWVGTAASVMGVTVSISEAGMDEMGVMSIQDGNIVMRGVDTDGSATETPLTGEFKDGKLFASIEMMGVNMDMTFELLEDGTLQCTMAVAVEGMNMEVMLYYAPAEAAANAA